jgi:hypothetical protein
MPMATSSFAISSTGRTPEPVCTIRDEEVTPDSVLGAEVFTRELTRGGTRERLLPEGVAAPRKAEAAYGGLVGLAMLGASPTCAAILSVGDSVKSDGAAAMGFRAAGIRTAFFCCNPKIRGGSPPVGEWGKDSLFTDTWDDLGPFVARHPWALAPTTLVVVDLDNTFWTPAGVLDRPATRVRDEAVLDVLARDTPGACPSRRRRCLEAAQLLEAEEFEAFCADDEERKALLAAAAAMTGFEMNAETPGLFPELDDYAAFLRLCKRRIANADALPELLGLLALFADNMQDRPSGCTWWHLREDLHSAVGRLRSGESSIFPAFRNAQRERSIDAAAPTRPADERFMVNRAVVDLIRLARASGCRVVGLTDRPALAIFPADGEGTSGRSLWTTSMGMTGPPLFSLHTTAAI